MAEPDEHLPDPAALDELQRAFGEHPSNSPAADAVRPVPRTPEEAADRVAGGDDAGDAADDDADDPATAADTPATPPPIEFDVPDDFAELADEPEDLVIVEQDPIEPVAEPTPPPAPVIRIDDYSGSVEVDDGTRSAAPVPPVVPIGVGDPLAPGGADAGTGADPDAASDVDRGGHVVIAVEDELPDAVYVEGSLDRSGNRTIVFIDDDETGDAVAPAADRDARRGIEPRLRERRAAIKRAMGRRRLRWLVAGLVAVLVAVGALALLGSGLFSVKEDNVQVFNAVYADPAALDAVIDDLVGTPTLRVDTERLEADLEAIPWVDEARVRVSFPDSATIELLEREAMATYQAPDQRYRVIDREGRVLDVRPGYPFAYVLLMGPDPVDLDPGEFAPQGYAAAAELAKNLTPSIRGQVDWIEVTADGSSLNLILVDGTEVRFGAARDLFNKLLRLETTLANNPELEPGVIDVSTSEVTFGSLL